MKVLVKHGMGSDAAIELLADSSILPSGRPFFIPDWASTFVGNVAVVARINRLGKCISSRFAHRYWDTLTVGLVTHGTAEDGHIVSEHALTRSHDGALLLGSFIGKDEALTEDTLLVRGQCDGNIWIESELHSLSDIIDATLTRVSQYMTLKMGDLICVNTDYSKILTQEEKITLSVGDQAVLRTKIK